MLLALANILLLMVFIALFTIGVSCIIVGVYYCWRACQPDDPTLDNQL